MADAGATERLRAAITRVLEDGQYHDREEIIAETRDVLTRAELLVFAHEQDYRQARVSARNGLGAAALRKWLEEHPDVEHYEPREDRGLNPDWGHRQYIMVILGRMYDRGLLDRLRASRNGTGKALFRWKGGGIAEGEE